MKTRSQLPIACTLQGGSYQQRLAWIAELARDGLRSVNREGLRLELTYVPDVADRVREMVRKEEECCAFLEFDLTETNRDVPHDYGTGTGAGGRRRALRAVRAVRPARLAATRSRGRRPVFVSVRTLAR